MDRIPLRDCDLENFSTLLQSWSAARNMVHTVRPPGFGTVDYKNLSPKELNSHLTRALADIDAADVIRHFVGFPLLGAPSVLNEAAVVCLDIEWWQHQPKPTTELGKCHNFLVLVGISN